MTLVLDFSADQSLADADWVVGIIGSRVLMRRADQAFLFTVAGLGELAGLAQERLYLGRWCGKPCYALVFPSELSFPDDFPLYAGSLRSQLGVASDALFYLAGRAQQLAHWSEYHRFCGRCGMPTKLQLHERVLACTRCGALFYPRIAPCVIGIVVRDDKCLLAHNANFREGLYSAIAGFIEPGETAEQALLREIYEETGIIAERAEYICSQPWPFPSQLMLGFIAHYKSGEIRVDGTEITDAGWFSPHDMPQIPPPQTISGKLIDLFLHRT
ncbi:NAD(+) diphosphatase [Saccharophagus sp. K07]|jgi:NAD+ diphosphatase|uniref:NAD(+) diphosphatase n=1 Tax=Saccharophagus sp. K07 TaxID=2283636 RepID=UPI0016528215|nr:NAD(+) diphosphatase [Saccharophagus sp. K07]MBC6906904.1 NAD(+) diphosphatase [Saccharophagus sp. K07]